MELRTGHAMAAEGISSRHGWLRFRKPFVYVLLFVFFSIIASFEIRIPRTDVAVPQETLDSTRRSKAFVDPAFAVPVSYPLRISTSRRYLVDESNAPFLVVGDSAWSLIAQLTNSDVDYYLADRQRKGFNTILVNLLEHKFATYAPKDIYGDAPFTGTPFTTPNEAYFAHADSVLSGAAQHGITVLLDPLYLGYNCGAEGWCAEVQAATLGDMTSWGQYVGNRYKSFPNIIWVIGADVDPRNYPGVPERVSAFVSGLQQSDPGHLLTAHNVRGEMAVTPWGGASWLTVNSIYTTNLTYPLARTAWNYSPTLPFFLIESYYENDKNMTPQGLRAEAYWTLLSGGFGYLFGNTPLWSFGFTSSGSATLDWKKELNNTGSVDMIYFRQLFGSLAWQDLVPDWNHTVLTAGYGTLGGTDYVTASRSTDGKSVIAYLPSTRTVTVNMAQLTGMVTAQWYDPTQGTYVSVAGSPFPNSGSRQFTPTGKNQGGGGDWVLVLTAMRASRSIFLPFIAEAR